MKLIISKMLILVKRISDLPDKMITLNSLSLILPLCDGGIPLKSSPVGYRFRPSDQELINNYLHSKINGHQTLERSTSANGSPGILVSFLTLVGSEMFVDAGGEHRGPLMLSTTLAFTDGRVFGGAIGGCLIAAAPQENRFEGSHQFEIIPLRNPSTSHHTTKHQLHTQSHNGFCFLLQTRIGKCFACLRCM